MSTAAADLNGDGRIGDENGDGRIDEADRRLLPPGDLIQRAHTQGLLVHTWTFRNEQRRLPAGDAAPSTFTEDEIAWRLRDDRSRMPVR